MQTLQEQKLTRTTIHDLVNAVTSETVETVTRPAIVASAQLGVEEFIREKLPGMAEKMLREEIERIKNGA